MRHLLPLLLGLIAGCVAPAAAEPRPAAPVPGSIGSIDKVAPQSRALYLKLIGSLRESGRPHAALAHLDSFDRQYPHQPEAALLRGDCLVDIGDYAQAAATYRQLLKTREAASAYGGLGRIEGLNRRWAGAAEQFARAVALAPTSPDTLNDYGFALLQSGRPADALYRLRQAAELAPGEPKVRNNLILALAATGNDADARRLLAGIAAPAERSEIEAEMLAETHRADQP